MFDRGRGGEERHDPRVPASQLANRHRKHQQTTAVLAASAANAPLLPDGVNYSFEAIYVTLARYDSDTTPAPSGPFSLSHVSARSRSLKPPKSCPVKPI